MDYNDYYMTNIDPEVFLRIGQSLLENEFCDFSIDDNFKKTLQEYKNEYLQKLYKQMNYLTEKRANLLHDYNLGIKFNRTSIDKITYFNNKLGKNNNNNNYHNSHYHSTATFISLRMKKEKTILNETIKLTIKNSQNLYELEKEINLIDFCIHKTRDYINLNI